MVTAILPTGEQHARQACGERSKVCGRRVDKPHSGFECRRVTDAGMPRAQDSSEGVEVVKSMPPRRLASWRARRT